tara:strand:- start:73214 stop:77761 length:4548 start_codon:yes stop_codon:yes gene_type:complete
LFGAELINASRSKLFLVLFVGIGCLIGLLCASFFEKKQIKQNNQKLTQEINQSLAEVASDIDQSLEVYALQLKGLRSFVYSIGLENLSHERFQEYALESDFEKNYPGSRGFGFIRFVDWKDEQSFIAKASKDRGEPFQIKYLSKHSASRFVIQYIEPEYKNQQAIGLDIGSERHRRSAALAAVHQNSVTLTAPITLVQANQKSKHGFLFLYPVFAVEESETLDTPSRAFGWVYTPLLIDEILSAIQQTKTGLSLDIADTTEREPVTFFQGGLESQRALFTESYGSTDITLFDRVWKITAHPTLGFVENLSLKSPREVFFLVFVGFLVASIFVANIFYLLGRRLQDIRHKSELAAVVENGIEGTIGLDDKFCLKYWNEAARSHFGFNDKSLHQPFLEWLELSYSADFLIDLFKQISKGQSIKGLELRLPADNVNEEKYLHLNFQPIIQKGAFVGANVSLVDLTVLRSLQNQLEEKNHLLSVQINRQGDALKASTSFHESMLQGADFLIITTNLKGLVTSVNRKLEELLDYAHEEVLDRNIVALFQKESLTKLSAEILVNDKYQTSDVFESLIYPLKYQSRIEGEFVFEHKNASYVELQLTISAIKNSDNDVYGYLFIADDIRQQKAMRFDLELIQAAIQSSEDILLWLDRAGRVCKSNPFASFILNYSASELGRLNVTDLLSLEVGEKWINLLLELDDSTALTFESNMFKKNGQFIPSLVTLSKLNINGTLYVFFAAKNITSRIEKEHALEEALNLAAKANFSKDQFLANMGHELRTPLNEVNGSLQLLQLTDLSSLQVDYLAQAKTSVRLLTQSIDDVLDCGEIISNQLALNTKNMNFLDLLDSVGHAMAIIAEDKKIEVHFDIADDVPHNINSDPQRLYQLLMCLMTNAVKFTVSGNVILKCSLMTTLENAYELSFQVIDSGIGISEEKQKNIFEFFSQVEMEANRNFGGLGLGLTISKHIVELMSGSINCQSEMGKGTTFTFNVFVGKDTSDTEPQDDIQDIPSLNVLVVDDNDISLAVISKLMTQLGWRVTTANSADSALDILQSAVSSNKNYDLTLIDWNMPKRSGLDLVKDIRAQFATSELPILVMVTAYTRKMLSQLDNRDVENLLSAFLTKPVTKNMLLDLAVGVFGSQKGVITKRKSSSLKLAELNILLIEDNPTNQFIAKNLLESQGANITLASEGEEAWQIINAHKDLFDIILMDIQMPGWDGYRTSKEIRADKRFDKIPILAMTANVLASDKRKCFEVGMNGHIGKPFELIQLVQEILNLVTKSEKLFPPKLLEGKQANKFALLEKEEHKSHSVLDSIVLNIIQNKLNIDVQKAIHRFGGSEDLYVQSLKMFIADLLKYENEIKSLNNNLVLETINPIFHTLKGTAGLLGFVVLSTLALECEQSSAMLTGKNISTEPIASLLKHMESIRWVLETTFNAEVKSKQNDVIVSSDQIDLVLLQELKQQLESSNMQAVEVFKALYRPISEYSNDLAAILESHINELQFKEALDLVGKLELQLLEHLNG